MNLDSFHQISPFLPQNLKNSSGKRDRRQALSYPREEEFSASPLLIIESTSSVVLK